MLHIGIVACSAEGAALCYRTICAEGARRLGGYRHPEISMHSHPFDRYVDSLRRGELGAVADLMVSSSQTLARAGADFLICPDNTVHQALPLVSNRSPLPWLHIGRVVARAAAGRGLRRVGVMGTAWLVRSAVYPDALRVESIECLEPGAADTVEVDRIIMGELVRGELRPESRDYLKGVVARFAERGCDGVVLGCTELPLILTDAECVLPVLDSTRLLATAALHAAVTGDGVPSTARAAD
jgi:aspartate racemase